MKTSIDRRRWLAGALVLLSAFAGIGLPPAAAHEAKCPVCKLDVVQDTDKLDHEVALRYGRKRIEYRSLGCALADAKTYSGDLSILAPSELKGKPVLLTRKEGKWSAAPETAVFVGHAVEHRSCELGQRALTTAAAFDKWVAAHPVLLKDAKPLKLDELLGVLK